MTLAETSEPDGFARDNEPLDILCIDPIRNLFDGGPDGGGENDNAAMMFFLKDRVEVHQDFGENPIGTVNDVCIGELDDETWEVIGVCPE